MVPIQEVEEIREKALAEISVAAGPDEVENLRIRYLGRKGVFRSLTDFLRDLPPDEKKEYGRAINEAKKAVAAAFEERKSAVPSEGGKSGEVLDLTLPGDPLVVGRRHILNRTAAEVTEIFRHMGFEVVTGPDIEDEYHNFVALNIPEHHLARSPEDNFYITDNLLLKSQTSPIQIRVMKERKPPLRIVSPGRCYRPETVDATHHYCFYQIEGLVVGEDVTFIDLKATIYEWFRRMYGDNVRLRFRPHYFPFTEPSAEVDILCPVCDGSGCSVCGSKGWIEALGCGMVDPHVFEAVGYDPEKYSGYAFGTGIERLAMRKYGIDDIRLFLENDLRFLTQL